MNVTSYRVTIGLLAIALLVLNVVMPYYEKQKLSKQGEQILALASEQYAATTPEASQSVASRVASITGSTNSAPSASAATDCDVYWRGHIAALQMFFVFNEPEYYELSQSFARNWVACWSENNGVDDRTIIFQ